MSYPRLVLFRFETTDPLSWNTKGRELRAENWIPCSNLAEPAESARRVGLAVRQLMTDRTMHCRVDPLRHDTRIVPGW
jgi:hypothetical protein